MSYNAYYTFQMNPSLPPLCRNNPISPLDNQDKSLQCLCGGKSSPKWPGHSLSFQFNGTIVLSSYASINPLGNKIFTWAELNISDTKSTKCSDYLFISTSTLFFPEPDLPLGESAIDIRTDWLHALHLVGEHPALTNAAIETSIRHSTATLGTLLCSKEIHDTTGNLMGSGQCITYSFCKRNSSVKWVVTLTQESNQKTNPDTE